MKEKKKREKKQLRSNLNSESMPLITTDNYMLDECEKKLNSS